jgi:hypothetical protein
MVLAGVNFKPQLGLQAQRQPQRQQLVALPHLGLRVKTGAHHRMGAIFNAKHQVATRLAQQAGRIGQRRQVFANGLRLVAVGLEFQPLRFTRLGAQAV